MPLPPARGSETPPTKASQTTAGTALTFLGVILLSTIGGAGWVGMATAVGVTLVGLGLLLRVIVPATAARTLVALGLTLTSCVAPPAVAQDARPSDDPAASAEALLDAIRDRYAATWYRTLSFVQETTFHTPQGPQTQTWYEAAQHPGRLRIDVAPLGAGNTFLVVGDSTHIAQGGRVVQRRPEGNPLLLLGFDLPFLTTAEGLAGMRRIGIDTDAVRVEPWQGREAIVVGGAPGDSTSAQAWFDRERLVFVRLIETEDGAVQDIRFNEYRPLAGGWIAPRVEIYAGGRLVMEEDYRAIQAGVDLPEGTFDPRAWSATDWWTAVGYDGTE